MRLIVVVATRQLSENMTSLVCGRLVYRDKVFGQFGKFFNLEAQEKNNKAGFAFYLSHK